MSEPKKYRRKPVVVEVVRWTGINIREIMEFCPDSDFVPIYHLIIDTRHLEDRVRASIGDYIIKGVQGEFYPCKPDIFEQTYEPYEPEGGRGCVTQQ